ncbi:hypothetical protein PVAP13_5KG394900 [Panicum virgatum]|uniref:Uncharacterized protein n=1 Tax=Panicum virgatum TaxID=38727 RepID=A0A8T0SKW9_PANVG|nr:hypothetical protein PVAP13_5KG394900 [Panicum virgatum]
MVTAMDKSRGDGCCRAAPSSCASTAPPPPLCSGPPSRQGGDTAVSAPAHLPGHASTSEPGSERWCAASLPQRRLRVRVQEPAPLPALPTRPLAPTAVHGTPQPCPLRGSESY